MSLFTMAEHGARPTTLTRIFFVMCRWDMRGVLSHVFGAIASTAILHTHTQRNTIFQ